MWYVIEYFDYLSNIELVDYNDGSNHNLINLLIGSDYLGRFFSGGLNQGGLQTAELPMEQS